MRIFERFWSTDTKIRTNSAYVYLNVYDSESKFYLQLFWDPTSSNIQFSTKEYY